MRSCNRYGLSIIIVIPFSLRILDQIVIIGPAITKKTKYNSYLIISTLALNILLVVVLVPKYGIIAAPISLTVASILKILGGFVISEKLYPIKFNLNLLLGFILSIGLWAIVIIKIHFAVGFKIIIAIITLVLMVAYLRRGLSKSQSLESEKQ